VEAHLVDPVPVAVMRHQLGREGVREPPVLACLSGAREVAQLVERPNGVVRTEPAYGLDKCGVRTDDVVADQRLGLVVAPRVTPVMSLP